MTDILYRSGGLRLRRFVAEDFKHIVTLNQEVRVTQSLFEKALLSERYVARYFVSDVISRYENEEGLGAWVAEKKNLTGEWAFQGWFNLSPVPKEAMPQNKALQNNFEMVELGSRLSTEAWGSQLSTLFGTILLERAFQELSLPQVHIHCLPSNRSAIYCTTFLGFEPVSQVSYFGQNSLQFVLSADRFSSWKQLPLRHRKLAGVAAAKNSTTTYHSENEPAKQKASRTPKLLGELNVVT